MRQRSLHARILSRMLAVILLVAGAFAAAAGYYARLTADQAFDALLLSGAAQITENMYVQGGVLTVEPPIAVIAGLAVQDLVTYKVVDSRGIVVAGNPALPTAATGRPRGPVLGEAYLHGQRYRTVTTVRDMPSGWATVTLAQTLRAREAMTEGLTAKAMVVILGMSAVALLGTVLAVRQALAPLVRVERAIAARDPQDLRPLDLRAPPEINTLLTAINAFMARLDAHIRQMQRLIGDAAHQVRTPLTALTLQLDLMQDAPNDAARRQHLDRVQDRAAQLGRLAAQLFDHAMVVHRSGVVRPEPIDLGTLVRQVLLSLEPLAGNVALGLDLPAQPVTVLGDRVSLREALSNLIHNALRHGARQTLDVVVMRDAGQVVVEIRDDGPGIPHARWQHVREPFHSRGEEQRGAGLGLAIADQVARAHGGTLSFRSRPGIGFAVIVTLPG